jgi:hypothetical protein
MAGRRRRALTTTDGGCGGATGCKESNLMVDEHRDATRYGTAGRGEPLDPAARPAYAAGTTERAGYHHEHYDDRPRVVRRISPSAVLAGAVLALVTLFMLNLLGVGIGLTTIDPARGGDDTPGLTGLGIGAGIWGAVTFLIALFIGGWVAGRLAGDPKKLDSMLHGLIAWRWPCSSSCGS